MARPTMTTCLAVLVAAMATMPSMLFADHQYSNPLVTTTYELDCAIAQFEQLACRRPLARHDQHRIQRLSKSAHRLAEDAKHNPHRARIIADVNQVAAYMRIIDNRLRRHCQLHSDPVLLERWEAVNCRFATVQQSLNGRSFRLYAPQVERLDPPPIPGLPAGPPVHDSRFIEPDYPAPTHRPGYDRYEERRDYRGPVARSAAPPWLDILAAFLLR
jgi:hypothetical protein